MNLCEKNETSCDYKEFRHRLYRYSYSPRRFHELCYGDVIV